MLDQEKRLGRAAWLVAAMLALSAVKSFAQPNQAELVFVGSGHKNIYAFWLNLTSGVLAPVGEVAELDAASFLATTPDQKYLYAITEGASKSDSLVSAFRIDPETGKLALLNWQPTGGAGPCYVAVDPGGADVLVANYNSGSVSVFPIGGQGTLGRRSAFVQDHGSSVNRSRQEGPHAHCIVTDPDDRFAFACDLGLDKVMIFKFDPSKGSLTANDPPFALVKPGAGPRHIAFHPNRSYAYVINEMASTLTAFAYDRDLGVLSEIDDYTLLPRGFKGRSYAAEVAVHPSGKFVYASNRGDDSIVVFGCDPGTGRLTFIERDSTEGKTPRNFDVDPSGAFLLAANQDSGTIIVFRIDPKTGHLQPTGNKAAADTPMCVKCLMLGQFLKQAAPPPYVAPANSVTPQNSNVHADSGVSVSPGVPVSPSSPASPASPVSPGVPPSPGVPASPHPPTSPGVPASPTPPASPASPVSPASPQSPSTFSTPRQNPNQFAVGDGLS